jgi:site-specific recombinase XerD
LKSLQFSPSMLLARELAPPTINVRLSAVRKLVGEARRNGWIDAELAATVAELPNVRRQGTRIGNWLTRGQAKELLRIPDRTTLKGKRLRDPILISGLRAAQTRASLSPSLGCAAARG